MIEKRKILEVKGYNMEKEYEKRRMQRRQCRKDGKRTKKMTRRRIKEEEWGYQGKGE